MWEVREKQRAVLEAALAKQPLGDFTGLMRHQWLLGSSDKLRLLRPALVGILPQQFRFRLLQMGCLLGLSNEDSLLLT